MSASARNDSQEVGAGHATQYRVGLYRAKQTNKFWQHCKRQSDIVRAPPAPPGKVMKHNVRRQNACQYATSSQRCKVHLAPAGYELLGQAQQHQLSTANVEIWCDDQYALSALGHRISNSHSR